jgi:hypothetical protein
VKPIFLLTLGCFGCIFHELGIRLCLVKPSKFRGWGGGGLNPQTPSLGTPLLNMTAGKRKFVQYTLQDNLLLIIPNQCKYLQYKIYLYIASPHSIRSQYVRVFANCKWIT